MDSATRKATKKRTSSSTPAAKFNQQLYSFIERQLKVNPEVDLTQLLPSNYASQLSRLKDPNASLEPSPTQPTTQSTFTEEKVLAGIHKAIQNGSVLGQSAVGSIDTVFKCNDKIALKTKPGKLDTTELTGLQYVTANFPDVPAPKPLGLISHGGRWYLFTSYVPGVSLNKIWLTLNEKQKRHISAALDGILEKLRRRSIPPGTALGGVSGEGCRDARRHTRVSQNPIFNTADFIDWLLSNPRHGDAIFFEVIRRVWHAQGSSSIVFTHGDLQPFNIMVEDRGDGYHRVTGLIDWDRSGFYPDWHECFKATNNLSWRESENDWALFLPSCISLEKYYSLWCLDRMGEHYIL